MIDYRKTKIKIRITGDISSETVNVRTQQSNIFKGKKPSAQNGTRSGKYLSEMKEIQRFFSDKNYGNVLPADLFYKNPKGICKGRRNMMSDITLGSAQRNEEHWKWNK